MLPHSASSFGLVLRPLRCVGAQVPERQSGVSKGSECVPRERERERERSACRGACTIDCRSEGDAGSALFAAPSKCSFTLKHICLGWLGPEWGEASAGQWQCLALGKRVASAPTFVLSVAC